MPYDMRHPLDRGPRASVNTFVVRATGQPNIFLGPSSYTHGIAQNVQGFLLYRHPIQYIYVAGYFTRLF